MNVKNIIGRGLKTGLGLAAATNATIMLASDKELGAPWAAINAICHVVDGDEMTQPSEWSPRESPLGIVINGTAMAVWGVLYEGALAVTKTQSSPFTGALGALTAYVVDYHLVPKRLTPGIEKKLSSSSLLAVYLALGIALSLSGRWNGPKSS
jgi:hypothetical protein